MPCCILCTTCMPHCTLSGTHKCNIACCAQCKCHVAPYQLIGCPCNFVGLQVQVGHCTGPGTLCNVQQQHRHDSLCLQTHTFGDPLLFRVTDSDTLADIKPRIQKLLGITDQDFAKWKFAINQSLRPPDYLTDEDNIATRFTKPTTHYISGTDQQFLGLEHVDAHPHRHRHHTNRYCFAGM